MYFRGLKRLRHMPGPHFDAVRNFATPTPLAALMPQQQSSVTPLSTFLIVCLFVLALFPGIFVSIFWLPYNSLANYLVPASRRPRVSVVCTSPDICVAAQNMSW